MKTTDMFLSAEERNMKPDNVPIVLTVQKMPQGQVLSPYIVSLRGSTGARKLNTKSTQKRISEKLSQEPNVCEEKNTFVKPEEDTVLSSIDELFRGKNARVKFANIQQNITQDLPLKPNNTIYKIPSQQEQFQKTRSEKKGFIQSWFE